MHLKDSMQVLGSLQAPYIHGECDIKYSIEPVHQKKELKLLSISSYVQ